MAEVKTGEGKSILLAGLSIYFALLGFQVDCACYSEILSKRDEQDFSELFQMCGVKDKINYGIFENVIRNLLNKKTDKGTQKLQDTIKTALLQKQKGWGSLIVNFFKDIAKKFTNLNKEKRSQMNILIIDEIDVLFDRTYFGDTFNQSINLHHDTITNLFKYMWSKKEDIAYNDVVNSQQFKQVIKQFSPLKQILENQIYGMIAALKTYEEQQYVILDKKIMYKVQDTYRSISYRYNTVYAYLKQHQKGTVSLSAFKQNMAITLCVSQFAYASLPQFYTHVVGVTGTLTCLPKYIKQYLQINYKINQKDMYPIPSVYSKKNQDQASTRTIHNPIITNQENHYAEIVNNLKPQFIKERPILIFFRGKDELLQFYNSPVFQDFQNHSSYLTEEHSSAERNERIKNSSRKKTITLLTNSFIRGIDFKLFNKKAKEIGGFHGIVAYLIESVADYVQAQGRVGRQGNKGSFIQIFKSNELSLLNLDPSNPDSKNKIKNSRLQKQQLEKESCFERLSKSKERHQQTMRVFNDPQLDQQKLIKYVQSKNEFPIICDASKKARMVFLIDATGSMSILFAQLKVILPQIFDDVYDTLKAKKFKGSLEIQIALYRNYNSNANKLLEISTFDNTGNSLRQFIKNSHVEGGWGNEAIQVGLQYVNTLNDIGEIIIIGDARGNTSQQVKDRRNTSKYLQYERIKKGYTPTCTQDQMKKLLQKNIKVSSFYLINFREIREYFQNLAVSSGGQAIYVDINKKQSSNLITQRVVQNGLKSIGGKNADQLLQVYKQILKRRMG